MMFKYCVYRHIRKDKNEVFYIGISKLLHKKFYRPYSKYGRTKYWHNIVNKTDYVVEIIFESNDENETKQKEIEFIKLYGRKDLKTGTLVNLTDGGEGTFNLSPEISKKRALLNKGKKRTEECKLRMSEIKSNQSQETRNKISLAHIGKKQSKHYKPIIQYDKNNNFIKEWESISLINQTLKITHISDCATNKRKSAGGFIWKFKN